MGVPCEAVLSYASGRIYALTLPYHFHLSTEEFKAIVEAPNVEEMKKQIENTYYGTHVHMKEGQSIGKEYQR